MSGLRPAHFIVLAALTALVFSPVLQADFVNWDDPAYVYENAAVLSFDVPRMFGQAPLEVYSPLTSLSFAIENALFGLSPFVFHLDNLLLHIAVALLLAGFFTRLGASARAAFLGALLFAVHPMRVESVAWVTERKDMLYALFYVLAMRQWWEYLHKEKTRDYGLTLAWAFLSLLSKPMALSLPLVLMFLEWFKVGDIRRMRWLSYLPLVQMVLTVGWLTYMNYGHHVLTAPLTAALTWVWSFCFYLWKFFLPFNVRLVYEQPMPVSVFRAEYALSLLGAGCFAATVWFTARRHLDRWLLLAAGIYVLSIFLLLRVETKLDYPVSDRFMYLASCGICLWLGVKADEAITRYGRAAVMAVAGALAVLAVISCGYSMVWHSSLSLWNDVMAYAPKNRQALIGRIFAYREEGRHDLAARDWEAMKKLLLEKQMRGTAGTIP